MDLYERVAQNANGLRSDLEAAREWGVHPTVFLRERTIEGPWTDRDTLYARLLKHYESGMCPGGSHVLAETSRPEHADAYRPGERIQCHYCKAVALQAEVDAKKEEAGWLVPFVLDADVVARNLLPVPPLPPELAGL